MKSSFKYLLLAIIFISAVLYVYIQYSKVNEGEEAPDFKAHLIDGSSFTLSELRGEYVLLDFWGSWCPPCRKENPELAQMNEKYSDVLTLVTIALEKDSLSWKSVAKNDGFVWKHQIVSYHKFVLSSPIARKYGVYEIPAKFLIDPEGKLIGQVNFKQIDSIMSLKL